MDIAPTDLEALHRAVESRDPRFDGWVLMGVTSTGIYCRPSCPTPVRPRREHVTFHRTAASAQRAGLRACKRCRPDAVPGSPAWDVAGDLVGRAMRLIGDGVVDREGVGGLARRLAVSERHLSRVLTREVGAGPLALARANRAQHARVLLESTALPVAEVAFAAGFSSVRQCNDTVREVYATTPTALRRAAHGRRTRSGGDGPGRPSARAGAPVRVRLPLRPPFDVDGLLDWLGARAIDGVEVVADGAYARALDLPGGPATVVVRPGGDHVVASFRLAEVADLGTAVARVRALLDLDADPAVVAEVLARDEVLAPRVAARPGLRVPGSAGSAEAALRAVAGQQASPASAARTCAALAAALGRPLDGLDLVPADDPDAPLLAALRHAAPSAEALAAADPTSLPLPPTRAGALVSLARQVAEGTLHLDAGGDRDEVRARLLATPGVGPSTADHLRLRALRDPDVLLASDLVVRRHADALGLAGDALARLGERTAPWRSYVTHHLWAAVPDTTAPGAAA